MVAVRKDRICRPDGALLLAHRMPPGKWPDEHRPLVDERGNVIGIVSAKVLAHGHHAAAALAASGALPESLRTATK